jgi:tetratricopeptide (TPR) repeat protein
LYGGKIDPPKGKEREFTWSLTPDETRTIWTRLYDDVTNAVSKKKQQPGAPETALVFDMKLLDPIREQLEQQFHTLSGDGHYRILLELPPTYDPRFLQQMYGGRITVQGNRCIWECNIAQLYRLAISDLRTELKLLDTNVPKITVSYFKGSTQLLDPDSVVEMLAQQMGDETKIQIKTRLDFADPASPQWDQLNRSPLRYVLDQLNKDARRGYAQRPEVATIQRWEVKSAEGNVLALQIDIEITRKPADQILPAAIEMSAENLVINIDKLLAALQPDTIGKERTVTLPVKPVKDANAYTAAPGLRTMLADHLGPYYQVTVEPEYGSVTITITRRLNVVVDARNIPEVDFDEANLRVGWAAIVKGRIIYEDEKTIWFQVALCKGVQDLLVRIFGIDRHRLVVDPPRGHIRIPISADIVVEPRLIKFARQEKPIQIEIRAKRIDREQRAAIEIARKAYLQVLDRVPERIQIGSIPSLYARILDGLEHSRLDQFTGNHIRGEIEELTRVLSDLIDAQVQFLDMFEQAQTHQAQLGDLQARYDRTISNLDRPNLMQIRQGITTIQSYTVEARAHDGHIQVLDLAHACDQLEQTFPTGYPPPSWYQRDTAANNRRWADDYRRGQDYSRATSCYHTAQPIYSERQAELSTSKQHAETCQRLEQTEIPALHIQIIEQARMIISKTQVALVDLARDHQEAINQLRIGLGIGTVGGTPKEGVGLPEFSQVYACNRAKVDRRYADMVKLLDTRKTQLAQALDRARQCDTLLGEIINKIDPQSGRPDNLVPVFDAGIEIIVLVRDGAYDHIYRIVSDHCRVIDVRLGPYHAYTEARTKLDNAVTAIPAYARPALDTAADLSRAEELAEQGNYQMAKEILDRLIERCVQRKAHAIWFVTKVVSGLDHDELRVLQHADQYPARMGGEMPHEILRIFDNRLDYEHDYSHWGAGNRDIFTAAGVAKLAYARERLPLLRADNQETVLEYIRALGLEVGEVELVAMRFRIARLCQQALANLTGDEQYVEREVHVAYTDMLASVVQFPAELGTQTSHGAGALLVRLACYEVVNTLPAITNLRVHISKFDEDGADLSFTTYQDMGNRWDAIRGVLRTLAYTDEIAGLTEALRQPAQDGQPLVYVPDIPADTNPAVWSDAFSACLHALAPRLSRAVSIETLEMGQPYVQISVPAIEADALARVLAGEDESEEFGFIMGDQLQQIFTDLRAFAASGATGDCAIEMDTGVQSAIRREVWRRILLDLLIHLKNVIDGDLEIRDTVGTQVVLIVHPDAVPRLLQTLTSLQPAESLPPTATATLVPDLEGEQTDYSEYDFVPLLRQMKANIEEHGQGEFNIDLAPAAALAPTTWVRAFEDYLEDTLPDIASRVHLSSDGGHLHVSIGGDDLDDVWSVLADFLPEEQPAYDFSPLLREIDTMISQQRYEYDWTLPSTVEDPHAWHDALAAYLENTDFYYYGYVVIDLDGNRVHISIEADHGEQITQEIQELFMIQILEAIVAAAGEGDDFCNVPFQIDVVDQALMQLRRRMGEIRAGGRGNDIVRTIDMGDVETQIQWFTHVGEDIAQEANTLIDTVKDQRSKL